LDRKLEGRLNSLNPWVLKVKEDSPSGSSTLTLADVDLTTGFLKNSSFRSKGAFVQQRRITWNTKDTLVFTPPLARQICQGDEIELFFVPYLDEELRQLRCEWTRIGSYEKYYVHSGTSWAVDGVEVDGRLRFDGELHSVGEITGIGELKGEGEILLEV